MLCICSLLYILYLNANILVADNGKVLKCINAGSDSSNRKVIPVVIEEFQVFQNQPITNLMVYHTPNIAKLVVVSHEEIKTIPLYSCDLYAKTCG